MNNRKQQSRLIQIGPRLRISIQPKTNKPESRRPAGPVLVRIK